MKKSGFTLVEMLVVIGIIAVLGAASMVGYSKVIQSARKAKNQELVSNAATALTHILNKEGVWPDELLRNGGTGQLDKDTAVVFVRHNLLGLAYNQASAGDNASQYRLIGKDRCGVVDAEAEAILKRSANASEGTKVSSGGVIKDHILYYAIDEDGDGFTDAPVEGGGTLKIRATAVVWAAGPDGKVEYNTMGRNDDVYSWRPTQVKR
ncbi:MAG: prepilin-type N-terminal cleavage/methylation domain-containing protein [Kiritimatiellae bacterium]|nr:prepilin-type N-terminal cleavage/methylation domain-containing protein [Kiritimatiellia bacterium]